MSAGQGGDETGVEESSLGGKSTTKGRSLGWLGTEIAADRVLGAAHGDGGRYQTSSSSSSLSSSSSSLPPPPSSPDYTGCTLGRYSSADMRREVLVHDLMLLEKRQRARRCGDAGGLRNAHPPVP